jgi:predicted Ser/Thr protein kinase
MAAQNRGVVVGSQGEGILKRDALGWIERVELPHLRALRRVADARLGLGLVARALLARERRALRALEGVVGVPRVLDEPRLDVLPGPDGKRPPRGAVLVRTWIAGRPLSEAESLPRDFFERLEELVGELHRRRVCHNDLHKEQNVIAGADGYPHLIDFQLASVHRGRGRLFASRVRDDLRHVQKHRRRYTRDGRGPAGEEQRGRGHGVQRSLVARAWRRSGKPLYNWLTRRVLRTRDG